MDILLQDMERCSPKGRDCFETNSSQTFNCSVTCEGVYADVQWEEDPIMNKEMQDELIEDETEMVYEGEVGVEAQLERLVDRKLRRVYKMFTDLERKMKLAEGNEDKMGKEMDKEKFWKLLSEYKKFKVENVRHFRFHSNATSSMFGKSCEFTSTFYTEEIHIYEC